MREFWLTLDEALRNGLSPEGQLPFNNQFLYQCLGFRIGRTGLEAYKYLENPLPIALTIHYNWPYPQFLTGEKYNILVVRDTSAVKDYVYSISDDMSTVTLIATINNNNGTQLEVADFGLYSFMTNGELIIYWNVAAGAWATTGAVTTIPMMRTICPFKGQAVGGNIVSGWYDCDETYYIWSKIGCFNFVPDQTNEAGYKRCPYGGEVYNVRRLGDNVIGYSSKGLTLIIPSCEPAATFGFSELDDIGLINQGAIDGNLFRHIYVGEDYILREVTREGIKELGYQWLMEQLTGTIIVNYEPSNKDFYISNGTKTFLLSPKGMSEITQHPSAVWRRDKQTYVLPETIDSRSPEITVWPFDFNYAGQKTNFTIESDINNYTDAEAALDYLLNQSWNTTSYIPINNEGVATLIASGEAFRYRLRFDSIDDSFRIGYLNARYKMTDLRAIRGVYAPPIRGQS